MSKISLEPNASGAGTFTLAAPNSNTNRTLNLPDESGILFSDGSGVPGSAVTGQLASSNMPAGSVIQVVQETTENSVIVSSTSFADSGLSASITPTSSTSKILVITAQHVRLNGDNIDDMRFSYRLRRDSVEIAELGRLRLSAEPNSSPHLRHEYLLSYSFLDSPNTTAEVFYDTQGRVVDGDQIRFQDDAQLPSAPSTITLMEIAG